MLPPCSADTPAVPPSSKSGFRIPLLQLFGETGLGWGRVVRAQASPAADVEGAAGAGSWPAEVSPRHPGGLASLVSLIFNLLSQVQDRAAAAGCPARP